MDPHQDYSTVLRDGFDTLRNGPTSPESMARAIDRAKHIRLTEPKLSARTLTSRNGRQRIVDALIAAAVLLVGLLPPLFRAEVAVQQAGLRIVGIGPLEIVIALAAIGAATVLLSRSSLRSGNVSAKSRVIVMLSSATLVLMLVVGAMLVGFGVQYRRGREQARVAEAARQLGWSVTQLQGGNWSVRAVGPSIGDNDLSEMVSLAQKFPTLYLDLGGSSVTDRGLRHLQELENLFSLGLSQTRISDAGLAQLGSMKRLRSLDLSGTRVGDAGMKVLGSLPLESLTLNKTDITDQGLREFPPSFPVYLFSLQETSVTDRGVVQLASWPKLMTLDLSHTQVKGEAFQNFKASPIQKLDLSHTEVSDATLMDLSALQGLWELHIEGTSVTADMIQRYRGIAPTVAVFK